MNAFILLEEDDLYRGDRHNEDVTETIILVSSIHYVDLYKEKGSAKIGLKEGTVTRITPAGYKKVKAHLLERNTAPVDLPSELNVLNATIEDNKKD